MFTAYFFGSPDTNRIVFSEINYNSSSSLDAGDWIELYNYGSVDIDISGWVFKDGNDTHSFVIPDNTIIANGEYLVLYRDSTRFITIFPAVTNAIGCFDFGLSSNGEALQLYDNSGELYLSMLYSTSLPWPVEANGQGATLELLNPYNDLNSFSNWFDGCTGGSPGGQFVPCDMGEEELQLSEEISMLIYPNPVSNIARIIFNINESDWVTIKLIDVYGRVTATLLDKKMNPGKHSLRLSADNLAPGVYYCRLKTSLYTKTKVIQVIN